METHKDFFKQFFQFINTADENLAQQLISPVAKFHVPGQPEPLQGPKGYLMIISMMRSGFPDIQWTLEDHDNRRRQSGCTIHYERYTQR